MTIIQGTDDKYSRQGGQNSRHRR